MDNVEYNSSKSWKIGVGPGILWPLALNHYARSHLAFRASASLKQNLISFQSDHLASLLLLVTISIFIPERLLYRPIELCFSLHNLITRSSIPYGFPSHINAETLGAIHEGGELGYDLSVPFGVVIDKPDFIVACVVGDGESESGLTATAWHAGKYIDPAESGAVIQIVHVNGFKISERTIYGRMDDKEMVILFTGYDYQYRFVEDLEDIVCFPHASQLNTSSHFTDRNLATSMRWALDEIRKIQKVARSGKPIFKPRRPVIIMRTPKGWNRPKKVDGQFVESSFHAHQVPLMKAKTDKDQLADLQKWLLSYDPAKLFTERGDVIESIKSTIPPAEMNRTGQRAGSYKYYEPLNVLDWRLFGVEKGSEASYMEIVAKLLDQALVDNPKSSGIFSLDELESNKLSEIFKHTVRNFQWDEFSNARGGRVIEMLSEHTFQGFLQGKSL